MCEKGENMTLVVAESGGGNSWNPWKQLNSSSDTVNIYFVVSSKIPVHFGASNACTESNNVFCIMMVYIINL